MKHVILSDSQNNFSIYAHEHTVYLPVCHVFSNSSVSVIFV